MHDPTDIFRKKQAAFDLQEHFRRQDAVRDQILGLQRSGAFQDLITQVDRATETARLTFARTNVDEMMRQIAGSQQRLAAVLPTTDLALLGKSLSSWTKLQPELADRLAGLGRATQLLAPVFEQLKAASLLDPLAELQRKLSFGDTITKSLAAQMAGIGSPWALKSDRLASVLAFSQLNEFSETVRSLAPLSIERAQIVSSQFGEYDTAFVEAETADEEVAEVTYTEAGRNPALVAFPRTSYPSVLQAAGWLAPPSPIPTPLREDGSPVEDFTFDAADHFLLTHVEAHLRDFIFRTLEAALGPNWLKAHVSQDRRDEWGARRQLSVARGFPELALIYYADFSELKDLICKRDLWARFFASVFGTKDLFVASMIRLHAIRVELSHARGATNTARLRLEIEANEILGALGALK